MVSPPGLPRLLGQPVPLRVPLSPRRLPSPLPRRTRQRVLPPPLPRTHPRLRGQVKGDHGNDRIPSWHPPARSRGSSGHRRRSKRLQRRSGPHAGANGCSDRHSNEHTHAGANGYYGRHSNEHPHVGANGCSDRHTHGHPHAGANSDSDCRANGHPHARRS